MFSIYHNITQILILQNAIGAILDKVGMEINSHSACIITNDKSKVNEVHLSEFPTIRGDCRKKLNNNFIDQTQQGVTLGCSFFVVSEECALLFLDNFHEIHDWVEQKYEKKVLIVYDTQKALTHSSIMDILRHRIVINDIPLTMVLQPNLNDEWLYIWTAYPYSSYFQYYNRFFISNFSFENDKTIIPTLTDLNGLLVIGALINYPPYTSYNHVNPGTGNAQLFNSAEPLSIRLDGQEHIILIEFCLKYNCTLTARLEYDEELWGEMLPNQTGSGMLGALTMRNANVSVAAYYLWDTTYEFMQYSAVIQRAVVTHIVPKPLKLPYWQTPILPFPGYIWGYVISTFLVGAVSLYVVSVSHGRINGSKGCICSPGGLFDSIYSVFQISLFQGVEIDIKFLSNIIVFTTILIYAFVIGNLYAGGLASVMTITRYEDPVDSLEKLVNSKFIWGGTASNWLDAIQQSEYPPHKKLISNYIVKSIPEVGELVKKHNKMAVTLEKMQDGTLCYQPYLDKESSKYYMIMKEPMYWEHTIVMSSKTWPFMEQLNRIVLMQQESGIRYYWEYLSATRTMDYDIQSSLEENAKPPTQDEPVRLSYQHILGAMYLLVFGNAAAMVSFLVELLLNYYKKKTLGKRNKKRF